MSVETRTPEGFDKSFPVGWLRFIRYCQDIGHGEIDKLKIADGVPVLAEKVVQKTKFA
jgi:hypothetical protein